MTNLNQIKTICENGNLTHDMVYDIAEKLERYEKALKEITKVPRDWSESYSQAWLTCLRIAIEALENETK